MTTTDYGSWYNHTGRNTNPDADIAEAISGGDSDWIERMLEAGALEDIENDWRAAIQAALPAGITLTGNQFIGPHHTDPDYTDEIRECDIGAVIESIDLDEIIERHDVDA